MQSKEIFTISNFAKLSQTTRDTLIYYDRIGLLSPVSRGENGYRLYSADQLALINIISICQGFEMPLAEIKKVLEGRTPSGMVNFLGEQLERIDSKVDRWNRTRKRLSHLQTTIQAALNADTNATTFQQLPEKAIMLGDLNTYDKAKGDHYALRSFYKRCYSRNPEMDMSYPVCGYFSEQEVNRGAWAYPSRYYFDVPDGPEHRPASLYAVGYTGVEHEGRDELFKRLIIDIGNNGYEICGPAYEEYPLNEVSVGNASQCLVCVLITVRKQ